MAAIIAPARVSAKHQSLLHLVGQAAWSDEAVLAKARELVLPAIEAQGKIEAWIVDDTAFAKKGVHSVGVARQYCGRLRALPAADDGPRGIGELHRCVPRADGVDITFLGSMQYEPRP